MGHDATHIVRRRLTITEWKCAPSQHVKASRLVSIELNIAVHPTLPSNSIQSA